jgi:hypothetical protein
VQLRRCNRRNFKRPIANGRNGCNGERAQTTRSRTGADQVQQAGLACAARACATKNSAAIAAGPTACIDTVTVHSNGPVSRTCWHGAARVAVISAPNPVISIPVAIISAPIAVISQYPYCSYQYPYCDYQCPFCSLQYTCCDYQCPIAVISTPVAIISALLQLSVPPIQLSVPLLRLSVPLLQFTVPLLRLSVPYCSYQSVPLLQLKPRADLVRLVHEPPVHHRNEHLNRMALEQLVTHVCHRACMREACEEPTAHIV